MEYPNLRGKLIALDLYNCDANVLEDFRLLTEAIQRACDDNAMQLLKTEHSDAEKGNAYTIFGICVQGHVILHAFPEYGFCVLDIYSNAQSSVPANCGKAIRRVLNPDKVKITVLNRGDFGSENDMKPHHHSSSKLIRRTKNFGRRLKKIILKPRGI